MYSPPEARTPVFAQTVRDDAASPDVQRVLQTLGERPLGFEQNQGQFESFTPRAVSAGAAIRLASERISDPLLTRRAAPASAGAIRFAARGTGYGIYLTDQDAVLVLRRGDNGQTAALRMSVIGAQPAATTTDATAAPSTLIASEPLPGTIRHYRGNGPARLDAETQAYARVTRTNVYDGIDLVYYGNQRRLEYDFVVSPGRDPRAIRVQFTGAERMEIEPSTGDLLLHVAGGQPVRQHKPVTYQVIDGARREVESRYVQAGADRVQFEVGQYDASQPLVIDPVLTYSTYFGSLSEEMVADIAVDPAGNIYVTGRTEDAPQFPVHNAFQATKPGKSDGFVSKFNPAGTALIYSTFLGGAEEENSTEHYARLAVDAAGNAYIAGTTLSANFPTTAGADDGGFQGDAPTGSLDAYYTKLDPNGALAYSTFIGGSRTEVVSGIGLDAAGNVYISGTTSSTPAEGFPITADAFDNAPGGRDMFLVKFNAAGTRVYATYVGGAQPENTADAYGGLAVDDTGKAYLVGDTWSTNYPVLNAAQPAFGGQYDAVLTVIDTTKAGAAGLVYSTYFGGTHKEAPYGIAYAGAGQVVIVGSAVENLPVKNAIRATHSLTDGFIAKFDTTKAGAASVLFATYYGGLDYDQLDDVAVDPAGGIHVIGRSRSADFPLVAPIRNTLWQTQPVVAKLSGDGQTIVYSSYLGSNTNNQALRAVTSNALGETYVGGSTWDDDTDPPSPQGVLIRNAFQGTFGGGDGDGWIAKIGFQSDVQITMHATPEPVLPNQDLTYTISVNNNSTDPAGNVVVTLNLPALVTYADCNVPAGGTCGGAGNTRTITFPVLPGAALANIVVKAKVNPGVGPGVAFTATATLTSTTPDSNPANNTANAVSHTPTLNPTEDADGDGLPNDWEQKFGMNPLDGTNGGANGANGDPDGDGKTNKQEYDAGTHPRGFVITYLAEGATGTFFGTRIAIANPGNAESLVLLQFQTLDAVVVPYYLKVAPRTRVSVDVEQVPGMESQSFSTLVEADEMVVVDRTMTWPDAGWGSHAERGTQNRTATTWYLAEGATHGNFTLFYLIQNAGTTPAEVDVTYLRPQPKPPIVQHYTIAGNSRFNIEVDKVPGLEEEEMSAIITSTNGAPIVVERAMYTNTPQQIFAGGHGSAGVTAPATRWFLAEGATGTFFDMYILIGNPTDQMAKIQARFLLIDGTVATKLYDVAPLSRFNIEVDQEPELSATTLSTEIVSTNNVPVVVERSMFWPSPVWREGHNSFGETTTGVRWAMAEGEQGGPSNTDTFILIANTSDFAGQARVTLLFEDGTTAERTFDLTKNSRMTVYAGADFPEANNRRFGAVVEGLGATPAQLVVERAMYTSPNGDHWTAGTNAVATKLQ